MDQYEVEHAIGAYKKILKSKDKKKPPNAETYAALGRAYYGLGVFNAAGRSYKKAYELDPQNEKGFIGYIFVLNEIRKKQRGQINDLRKKMDACIGELNCDACNQTKPNKYIWCKCLAKKYCSSGCKTNAWNSLHQWECTAI